MIVTREIVVFLGALWIIVILSSIHSALTRIATALEDAVQELRSLADLNEHIEELGRKINRSCEDCGIDDSPYVSELKGRYCHTCQNNQ